MIMEKTKLHFSHEGSVANITLSNGKGNVIDAGMMDEILHIFSSLKTQSGIKLIVFAGEGKHFSFGASVEEHTRLLAPAMLASFHRIFLGLIDMNIPTMAKISGQCLGGGLELALICNFLFADQTAILGQPEIVLGVFPPPASVILPLKIGSSIAEEILLTGKNIPASEGKRIGLINEVFSDRESMDMETDRWISEHILPKSASSLRFANRAARTHFNEVVKSSLPELESMYLNQLMITHDANEGISSFLEKRNPVWVNG
jgi:cyclohexa-1,5-dienecarbonyl-CoA hydratase